MDYNCFTRNINEANAPQKRKKILLGKIKAICPEENHNNKKDIKYLTYKTLDEEFISADIKKRNGVALSINPQLNKQFVLTD